MTNRRQLPPRRPNETFIVEAGGVRYYATIGMDKDGTVLELFLNSVSKMSSTADVNAADAAVSASLALQYGCPLETLRNAMKRDDRGYPQGPLGAALDMITKK